MIYFFQNFQVFTSTKMRLNQALSEQRMLLDNVTIATNKDATMHQLMQNSKALFPDGVFLHSHQWIAKDASMMDFKYAWDRCTIIITNQVDDPHIIDAVTFVQPTLVQRGTLICAFHYSQWPNSGASLTAHMSKVAQIAEKVAHPERNVTLMVHFPLQMPHSPLVQYFSNTGLGEHLKSAFGGRNQVIYYFKPLSKM